jgi:hypothetical protein
MGQTIIGQTKPAPIEERFLPEPYKNEIIESRYVPQTSLLSFVPGTPTRVIWYRQYLGRDEEQHSFQPESIETYQSYTRIHNLIVKLDDGNGGFNFEPVTRQSVLTLTGYVLFDLAPNKGDVFVKDIGDGKAGLFVIREQPEIRTIQADKVYYFEATIETEMTTVIQENLDRKVVKELYYSKESAVNGGNAVLTANDWQGNKELTALKFAIMDDILANHYYSDEDTIIIPNELRDRLYDPYLAEFLSYVMPANEIAPRNKIRTMSVQYWVEGTKMQKPMTVWDMFYRNDFGNPKRYKQEYYEHNRGSLINTRLYGNVFYSKMDRAITVHEAGAVRNPYLYTGALIPNQFPQTLQGPKPGIKWNYFFGDDFYEGGGTDVQKFIWAFFRDKTIDKKGLVKVLEGYWDLDPITKLYMGGIYLVAIKYALVTSSDFT